MVINYQNSTSGQETLYFCLKGLPKGIIAQEYSTSAHGPWEIRILLVALIPARKRKKKKDIEEDKLFDALEIIVDKIREDSGFKGKEITEKIVDRLIDKYKLSKKEILESMGQGVAIPSSIFTKELGALESLVKYLKENLKMSYGEIARTLERDERTIWTAYKKSIEKKPAEFNKKQNGIVIPLSIFGSKKLTVLESLIFYLKEKGFNFKEISMFLGRDQRNIWTIYSRIKNKTDKRKE